MWEGLGKREPLAKETKVRRKAAAKPAEAAPPTKSKRNNWLATYKPGSKIGLWTLVKYIPGTVKGPDKEPRIENAWECVCECGNKRTVKAANLYNGITGSCGCAKRRENRNAKKFICVACEQTKMAKPDSNCFNCMNLLKSMRSRPKAALKFAAEISKQQEKSH